MRLEIKPSALIAVFMRSFLVQGSWNYHTMLGLGFAFAMLPGLRSLYEDNEDMLEESLKRHAEHFNAHPYLIGIALGASLRLEAEGAGANTVRSFKTAVRGPLGSLGDSLVWATWLPGVSVLALALYWLGLPGSMSVLVFLLIFNAGHLGLRIWGFRVGCSEGRDVGRKLQAADLSGLTSRLRGVAALLLGLLVGALLGAEGGLVSAGLLWVLLSAAGFLAGLVAGHYAWRPAAATVVLSIVLLTTWGLLR